jgi:hypothetical protein
MNISRSDNLYETEGVLTNLWTEEKTNVATFKRPSCIQPEERHTWALAL